MNTKNSSKIHYFKIIIDILQAIVSRLLVYYSLWGLINGMGFGNWFHTKYLRLRLLHYSFALRELYIIALLYVISLLY